MPRPHLKAHHPARNALVENLQAQLRGLEMMRDNEQASLSALLKTWAFLPWRGHMLLPGDGEVPRRLVRHQALTLLFQIYRERCAPYEASINQLRATLGECTALVPSHQTPQALSPANLYLLRITFLRWAKARRFVEMYGMGPTKMKDITQP